MSAYSTEHTYKETVLFSRDTPSEKHSSALPLRHDSRVAVSLTQNTDECCDLGVGLRRERDSHMIKIRSRTGRYVLASMVEFALASRSLTMLTAPVVQQV